MVWRVVTPVGCTLPAWETIEEGLTPEHAQPRRPLPQSEASSATLDAVTCPFAVEPVLLRRLHRIGPPACAPPRRTNLRQTPWRLPGPFCGAGSECRFYTGPPS